MFNLKFFKSLKEALDTKANLLTFASAQRKANEEYIESLSSNELKIKADEQRLEAMVRQQLKEEFPNIEKSSSYDLLVDAVIHNYKSKQLQATDGAEIDWTLSIIKKINKHRIQTNGVFFIMQSLNSAGCKRGSFFIRVFKTCILSSF